MNLVHTDCAVEGIRACTPGVACVFDGKVTVSDGQLTVTGGPYNSGRCHSLSMVTIHGGDRARSHYRFVLPLICSIPDSLTYSVPLFLKRQCDRTLGGELIGPAAESAQKKFRAFRFNPGR
jgi:hypothetical protein